MKLFREVLPGDQTGSGNSYAKLLLSELRMNEARERVEAGQFASATDAFRSALYLLPGSHGQSQQEAASLVSRAAVSNARRLQNLGRWTDAVAVLQQAVTFDPKDEEAYVDLANSLDEAGKDDKAVEAMRHAEQIRPSVSNIVALGDYLRRNKQYPEAITQLNQAISLDPDSERAHMILGLTFVDGHDSDKALHEFQTASALKPTAFVYRRIALIYDARKDYRQALDNLNKGKAIDKTYVPLYEDADHIYHEEQGDFEAAYRELSDASTAVPNNVSVAADFAEACLTDGRFEEAVDTVDKLLGSRLPSPDLSVSDQVALRFIKVAALSLNGHSLEANASRQALVTYLAELGPFKQTWDYAGTKRFLIERE